MFTSSETSSVDHSSGCLTTSQASLPEWGHPLWSLRDLTSVYSSFFVSMLSNDCHSPMPGPVLRLRYSLPGHLSPSHTPYQQVQTKPPDGESFLRACEKCRKEGVKRLIDKKKGVYNIDAEA